MATVKEKLIELYNHDLTLCLENVTEYGVSDARKQEILAHSAGFIDWDDWIAGTNITEESLRQIDNEDASTNPMAVRLPKLPKLPKLPNLPLPGRKELCWIKTVAIASGLIAAWVASGGTLFVGQGVVGVQITAPIYQALVSGASGATLAKIICG